MSGDGSLEKGASWGAPGPAVNVDSSPTIPQLDGVQDSKEEEENVVDKDDDEDEKVEDKDDDEDEKDVRNEKEEEEKIEEDEKVLNALNALSNMLQRQLTFYNTC